MALWFLHIIPRAGVKVEGSRSHARPHRLVAAALIMLMLLGCEQTTVGTPSLTTISIAGATTMQPVLRELTSAFTARHPNVVFDLRQGGSALGEEWVQDGRIDVAATTLLPDDGAARANTTTASLVHTPIGLDGIVLIVHPDNPVNSLTLSDLRDLYTGQRLNWSTMGGFDESIRLVSRENGSGTRHHFERRVVGDEEVALTSIVMPTSATVVDYVAEHRGAIGYVTRAYVSDLLDQGDSTIQTNVRAVALEGALPTTAALREQTYALPQPLYLVTRDAPSDIVRQFIDFVLSPAGQELVAQYHLPIR